MGRPPNPDGYHPWFRYYRSTPTNEKIAALSDRQFRLWMDYLSYTDEDGYLPSVTKLTMEMGGVILARYLEDYKTVPAAIQGHLETLIGFGLFDRLPTGYRAHDWDAWQPASDRSNRKRQQRFRESHKDESTQEEPAPEQIKEPAPQPLPRVVAIDTSSDLSFDQAQRHYHEQTNVAFNQRDLRVAQPYWTRLDPFQKREAYDFILPLTTNGQTKFSSFANYLDTKPWTRQPLDPGRPSGRKPAAQVDYPQQPRPTRQQLEEMRRGIG